MVYELGQKSIEFVEIVALFVLKHSKIDVPITAQCKKIKEHDDENVFAEIQQNKCLDKEFQQTAQTYQFERRN